MQSVETLHPREAEIRAIEAMEAEVAECGAGIAPLIKARTPKTRQILRELARLLVGDVSAPLAMTDPARYRKSACESPSSDRRLTVVVKPALHDDKYLRFDATTSL